MKSVVIVDDHPVLARLVADALREAGIATATALAHDAPDLDVLTVAARPDLCLFDLDLGDEQAAGTTLARTAFDAGLQVAMFTGSTDEAALGRCIGAGASGIIGKHLGFAQVTEAVSKLLRGEGCNTDADTLRWVLAAQRDANEREKRLHPFGQLSRREQAVLRHLIDGLHVDQIAEVDYVSTATVRSQVRAVLRKLDVRSQLAAVALAHRVGWPEPEEDVVSH